MTGLTWVCKHPWAMLTVAWSAPEAPTGCCLPVSVLDRQVLLHSFHQVPEALGKDFLLGERLAVYQTRPQFTEILLGDRAVSGSVPNSKPGRKEVAGSQASWGSIWAQQCSGACILVHPELFNHRENPNRKGEQCPQVNPAPLAHCHCLD